MGRIKTFFLLVALLSAISAHRSQASQENGELHIVASFYPAYIMALNVVKDVPGVSVSNLTPPMTGCLHDYALTTNDMKKLADDWLPKPTILHLWPNQQFAVRHSR